MSFRVLPLLMSSPSLSSRLRNLWLPGSGPAQLEAAERRVLSRVRVPFLQRFVPIGDGQFINTLHIVPPSQRRTQHNNHVEGPTEGNSSGITNDSSSGSGSSGINSDAVSVLPPSSSAPPLVLLHGFGAGIGLWYANLDALSTIPADGTGVAQSSSPTPGDVYCLDMLGCGRSSRPHFSARTTADAESFFVDSLDRWRAANGIERMCLAGHSFGGYMAAAYAMRHPHRVSRLILLSPVGVPQPPADYDRRMSNMSTSRRALWGLVSTLWQSGVTPNQFIRAAGPYGKSFIERYVSRRFRDSPTPLSDELAAEVALDELEIAAAVGPMDKAAVTDYIYNMIVAPSSGDRALSLILKPGAHAYHPLADRLPAALTANSCTHSSSHSSSSSSATATTEASVATAGGGSSVPVVFVYGVTDWMDRAAGASTAAAIVARGGSAISLLVKGAGHQLNLDHAEGFKECMQAAMSFPADAGQASRQQWINHVGATYQQIIVDTST